MRYLAAAGLTLVAMAAGTPAEAQREVRTGQWEAELRWRPRQGGPRQLWIEFQSRGGRWRSGGGDFGFTMKASDLSGLSANDSRWSGDARFELRRDAGVLVFEGKFEDGLGEGTYRFQGDGRFLRELDLAGADDVDTDELLAMVIHDVRRDWVTGLRQAGVQRMDADDLLAMRIHGVMPEFVQELSGMGFRGLTADRLTALRIHGVTSGFIRDIKTTVDPAPSLDDLVAFRIHKVTPEFAKEVAGLGYPNADADDLVAMRIHGVSPGFIRSIRETGLRDAGLDDLLAFRIHGIDADFIKEATGDGVRLDADDLVSYRIHRSRWVGDRRRGRSRDRDRDR